MHLAVFTKPMPSAPDFRLTPAVYNKHRENCEQTRQSLLDRGMQVETPEAVVNNARRARLIGTFSLVKGDIMCYSAQNQYEKLYVGEGSDAIRSLLLWGYEDDAKRMIPPVLESARQGLMCHRAGIKLQLLNHYFWLTREAEYVRAEQHRWLPEVQRILSDRAPKTGLLPRERYRGDVGTLFITCAPMPTLGEG